MRRRGTVTAALAVTVLVAAPSLACTGPPGAPPGPPALTVRGDVEGLHPGARLTLDLSVENPYRFAIRVRSVTVDVSSPEPDCPPEHLEIPPVQPDTILEGRATGTVGVPVSMGPDAPDACQGIEFALTHHVTATRAPTP